MNLRGLRARLTLLFVAASAVAVAVLGWMAASYGAAHLDDGAQTDLQQRAADIAATSTIDHPPADQPDGWFVNLTANPPLIVKTGAADFDAGVVSIANEAHDNGGTAHEHLTYAGSHYLVFARMLPPASTAGPTTTAGQSAPVGSIAIVTASNIDDVVRSVRSLRIRIAVTAVALVAGSGVLGFFVAGRSLRPARRAAEQQREFIADAAHELRTPLAIIQASASHALARPRASEEYVRALAEIRAAAERAGIGVGELLDLARLDAGQAPLRTAALRLDLLAEEIVASIRADTSDVTLDHTQPVIVNADMTLLRQAIQNVVLNATQHAPHVTVSVRQDVKRAIVEVEDDGEGFPPELLDRAFTRYAKGEHGGLGLGLSIVQSVVSAHNGTVIAANTATGALVTISLPIVT